MSKRFLSVVLAIVLFSSPSFALEVEGDVVARYDMVLLLDTGGGEFLGVRVSQGHYDSGYPAAEMKNLFDVHHIKMWDHLRIKGQEVHGMLVAEEVEAAPYAEFDQALKFWGSEVKEQVESGGDYILVDTRPSERYEAGHIPTALSMPEFDSGSLPEEKDKLVIFYSLSKRDPGAARFAQKAIALGYTNVKIYDAGMQPWINWGKGGYHAATTPAYVKRRINEKQPLVLIDTRLPGEFGLGHIPGAIPIPLEEITEDAVMPMSPYPVVFYGEDAEDTRAVEAARKVALWGYGKLSSAPVNVLEGGFKAWLAKGWSAETGDAGSPRGKLPPGVIALDEFRKIWDERDSDKVILDVRMMGKRPEFVTQIPIETFPFRIKELPMDKEIIIFCSIGYRARMVYHILKDNGYSARYLNRKIRINADGTLE